MAKPLDGETNIGRIFAGIVLCFVILVVLFGSFYTVTAGYRGVVLTFGKASPVASDEGLHFKIPIIQKVVKMSVQTQKYEADATAASKDLQVVSTKIAVNYHAVPERVPELYSLIGLGYEDRVIQPNVQEVLKATTAEFTAEELITKRPEVKAKVHALLRDRLLSRGIVSEDISITDFDFSDSFNQAIESKVTAEQLKLKAERDLDRIRIEAEQKEAQAIGERNAAIASAEGESQAIKIIDQELKKSPNYLEWLKINKWDGVLPKATGAGAVPFIDIEKK